MWAIPANSLPRRSPGCPLVSTQTQYFPGDDSRCSSAIAAAFVQPFFEYVVPSLTRTAPFEPVWIDAPVMPVVVGRSNAQQSWPDLLLTCRLTTPCSPMPERR